MIFWNDFECFYASNGRDQSSLIIKMPELRSSETDTEIWLSSDLKDTVLIHSDMLKTSSWFRASLSEAWTSSMTDNLSTSKQKNGVLYSYGLKADIDDHAYSLHRGVGYISQLDDSLLIKSSNSLIRGRCQLSRNMKPRSSARTIRWTSTAPLLLHTGILFQHMPARSRRCF